MYVFPIVINSAPIQCDIEHVAPIQFPLVNRFYKRSGYRVSCGRLEHVYCLRATIDGLSSIIAAARFLPQESQYYLLRNLCVDQHWRRRGLARRLMQSALKQLETRSCYCFAQGNLQNFYESLGFVMLSEEDAPHDIARRYQGYSQSQRDLILLRLNG